MAMIGSWTRWVVAALLLGVPAFFLLRTNYLDPELAEIMADSVRVEDAGGPIAQKNEIEFATAATPKIESSNSVKPASQPYMFEVELNDFLAGGRRITGAAAVGIVVGCQGWEKILDTVYQKRVGLPPGAAAELTANMESRARACQFLTPEHIGQVPSMARRAFSQGEKGASQLVLAYAAESLTSEDLVRVRQEIRDDFLACVPYSWTYLAHPAVRATEVERAAALFVHEYHRLKQAVREGESASADGPWKTQLKSETVEAAKRLAADVIARCQE